jgi:hypothetical protein
MLRKLKPPKQFAAKAFATLVADVQTAMSHGSFPLALGAATVQFALQRHDLGGAFREYLKQLKL